MIPCYGQKKHLIRCACAAVPQHRHEITSKSQIIRSHRFPTTLHAAGARGQRLKKNLKKANSAPHNATLSGLPETPTEQTRHNSKTYTKKTENFGEASTHDEEKDESEGFDKRKLRQELTQRREMD